MAIQLKRTSDVHTSGIKALVYGHAGAGKTTLAATLPKPVIISAEAGLLSIAGADLPYIEVKTMDDLRGAFEWVSEHGAEFDSIVLDSISEIAEVCLNYEKKMTKDPRQAYGAMQEQMTDIIRAFRDLPKNVLFIAKVEKQADETGRILYSPSMPGNKTGQALPYFFDLVLALRVERDGEGATQRALMCDTDGIWQAKDRSGKLNAWESPDMGDIIKKIGGV